VDRGVSLSRHRSKRRPARKASPSRVPAKGNGVQIAALAIVIGCACTVICGYAFAAAVRYSNAPSTAAAKSIDAVTELHRETPPAPPASEDAPTSPGAPARRSRTR